MAGPSEPSSSARPVKRRRSPSGTPQHGTQDVSNTPGDNAQQRFGKAPLRKRIRESEVNPSRRARSPDTRRPHDRSRSPARSSPPESNTAPPTRKRPGAGARIDNSARQAAEERRKQREAEERRTITGRVSNDLVATHYNSVPQRGREWRKTDSSIRGLRSFNNWVKSALIQKFSTPDIPVENLLVLDIGCGKGGDLQKWQSAPQMPALYVGIDPAATSIEQAKGRFDEMLRRRRGPRGRQLYDGHFFVQDCFGQSIGHLPIIQQVGFDWNAGPDPSGNIIAGRFAKGGFDIISMMFCLHYSFENEAKARGMLKNVAGALKKGGRFLGVMPNSDILTSHVEKHFKGVKAESSPKKASNGHEKTMSNDGWDPERGSKDDKDDDWDPEKPSANDDDWDPEKPVDGTANGGDDEDWDPEKPSAGTDDWDPEKPSEPVIAEAANGKAKTPIDLPPLEWGNSIYKVKFPQNRPLPVDGIFRPPYGWKYFYYLEEAVDVPEYVVPWEGFRALAEDYGLELEFRRTFTEIWDSYKDDRELGPLADRMGVRDRDGRFAVSPDEVEAASFYHAFAFRKI